MLRKPRRMADALKALRFAAKLAWAANPTALLINLVARLMGAVIPAATVHITALLVSAVQNSPDAGPRPVVFLACLQTGVFLLQFGLNTVSGLSSQLASEQTTNHVLGLVAEQVQCYRFDERQTTSFNENLAFIRYSAAQRCYQPISQFIDTTGSVISLISVLTVMSRANWVIGLVVLLATGGVKPMTVPCTTVRNCGCTYDPIGKCFDQWCCDTRVGEMCWDTGCVGFGSCPSC